jgi:hypothetical protein
MTSRKEKREYWLDQMYQSLQDLAAAIESAQALDNAATSAHATSDRTDRFPALKGDH